MLKIHPFTISILSKRDLHPLQAAANLSGERMLDMANMSEHAAPKRSAMVVYSDLLVPDKESALGKHLPDYLKLRNGARDAKVVRNAKNTLWVRVDWMEKRDDAQFARLFTLALPSSLDLQLAQKALRDFSQQELIQRGMVVDLAIHETRREGVAHKRNAYAMATTRPFHNGDFQNKDRSWNDRSLLTVWRKSWFDILQNALISDQKLSENPNKHTAWLELCADYLSKPANREAKAEAQMVEETEAPAPARAKPRL